ncbi:hypothetical protein ACLIKD_07715 [Azonexus sp. IMCC34842]|uniref:hypothetical protein n=1 Tax=Azonexus sp. IMCC34842 TaxID=3420950 RepID=UPI003D127F70
MPSTMLSVTAGFAALAAALSSAQAPTRKLVERTKMIPCMSRRGDIACLSLAEEADRAETPGRRLPPVVDDPFAQWFP